MKHLDLTITADVDGIPVPGCHPLLRRYDVREAFKFRTAITSSSYADLLSGLVPSSDVTVRFLLLTTDAAITAALFEDGTPDTTFNLAANQLLIIAGNTIETAIAGNPFIRVSVASGTANLTGIVGLV